MKKITFLILIGLLAFSFLSVNGQTTDNQSYSVYTYVLIGSNDSDSANEVSGGLARSLEKIKNEFGYSKFQLLSTHFQNVKESGRVSYKSFLRGQKFNVGKEKHIFASLTLDKFYKSDKANNNSFGFGSFGFQARFPIVTSTVVVDGKNQEVINYESVGTNSRDVEFRINQPTLIGSLPIGEQTFFFIVKLESNN